MAAGGAMALRLEEEGRGAVLGATRATGWREEAAVGVAREPGATLPAAPLAGVEICGHTAVYHHQNLALPTAFDSRPSTVGAKTARSHHTGVTKTHFHRPPPGEIRST